MESDPMGDGGRDFAHVALCKLKNMMFLLPVHTPKRSNQHLDFSGIQNLFAAPNVTELTLSVYRALKCVTAEQNAELCH